MRAAPSGSFSNNRDRILDAWRGLSVLLVICDHVIDNQVDWSRLAGHPSLPTGSVGWRLHHFAHYVGGFGVQFFFVVSGYIITDLLLREQQRNGSVSLAAFYVRRAFRILPPLWLVLGTTAALSALGAIDVRPESLLLGSSFLCNVQIERCGWFVGHLWSLGVEEQFYLVWPLILVALRFRGVSQAALLLSAVFFVLIQYASDPDQGPDNPVSFACIALGCLYAASGQFRSLIQRAAIIPLIALAAALLIAMALAPIAIRGQYRLQNLLHPLLVCFLLFSCFRYRTWLERRFIVRALAGLGGLSYGIYLWQQLFLARSDSYLHAAFLDFAPALLAPVLLSYFLVEKPLIRIGAMLSRQLIQRRTRIVRERRPTARLIGGQGMPRDES